MRGWNSYPSQGLHFSQCGTPDETQGNDEEVVIISIERKTGKHARPTKARTSIATAKLTPSTNPEDSTFFAPISEVEERPKRRVSRKYARYSTEKLSELCDMTRENMIQNSKTALIMALVLLLMLSMTVGVFATDFLGIAVLGGLSLVALTATMWATSTWRFMQTDMWREYTRRWEAQWGMRL